MTTYPSNFYAYPPRDGTYGQNERDDQVKETTLELIAVQEVLGTNPQGAYNTVSERIAAATGEVATWGE